MTSKINQKRIRILNTQAISNDKPVVYWMNRDCRVQDNWALLYAIEQAEERKVPLFVVYNLVRGYLGGGNRQWDFKVKGLIEVQEKLADLNIPFYVIVDDFEANSKGRGLSKKVDSSSTSLITFFAKYDVGQIVTDFSPIKTMYQWTDYVAKNAEVQVVQVDAHNIVPVWATSSKREFGAYTIRPKIHKLLPEFLTPFPVVRAYEYNRISKAEIEKNTSELASVLNQNVSSNVHHKAKFRETHNTPVDWIVPGGHAASVALKHFIKSVLPKYNLRNDPNANAQSGLSPYLHYGHIGAQRVALEVWKDSGVKDIQQLMHEFKNAAGIDEMKKSDSASLFHSKTTNHSAFLEELVVRRELADNFCWYAKDYDKTTCFPDWSQKNLKNTANDKREYIYDLEEFEEAKTHDELWNAAQMEMVITGKMHGYMRMYWAKKILEWTPNAQIALDIAIELNDVYELDGRDPNGYAGIAWSIGGVHDRTWFSRSVFGQVRYMNAKGCRGKFDVDKYIEKWLGQSKGKLF